MTTRDQDSWLTIQEAAETARVSRRTIYNWMLHGRLTTRRNAGGSIRILESSLWQHDSKLIQLPDPE